MIFFMSGRLSIEKFVSGTMLAHHGSYFLKIRLNSGTDAAACDAEALSSGLAATFAAIHPLAIRR
ncbi:MAG: hypothetical protein AAGF29_01425 [Pseudomonadota bacterium]